MMMAAQIAPLAPAVEALYTVPGIAAKHIGVPPVL
jgi:hypothetical protein